nr:unnamed protein product [Digitaria exilis]
MGWTGRRPRRKTRRSGGCGRARGGGGLRWRRWVDGDRLPHETNRVDRKERSRFTGLGRAVLSMMGLR